MKKLSEKRWLMVLGIILAQLGLGTIYTWSLFNQPLANEFGFDLNKVAITFSITSFALAASTLGASKLNDKLGIRKLTSIAGIILGIGLILTSVSSSLPMFYITAGVIVGAADGIAYINIISNAMKWFPDKKGLISGISVGAYGIGSLVFKYINGSLISNVGVSQTFLYWGLIAMALILLGAQFLKDAPLVIIDSKNDIGKREFSIKEMLKTKEAYALFIILFSACMGGLYLIGIVKDIGVQLVGLTPEVAANAVAMVAIFNTAGRIVLGALSDKMGRLRVVILGLSVTAISVFVLSFVELNFVLFFACVASIAFFFGGNITVFSAIIGDFFGTKNQAKNYGIIYQGFGLGAIASSFISSVTGGFKSTFIIIGALCLISIALASTIQLVKSHKEVKNNTKLIEQVA